MTKTAAQSTGASAAFRVPFGIGCWRFGIRRERPFRLSISDYTSLLSSELESITSLTNLEINADEDNLGDFVEEHLEDTDFGPAVFPGQTVFRITFELYIPFRVQKEIVGVYFDGQTGTERFRVHHHHVYHETVSFVEPIGSQCASDPSTAVQVVRKYLLMQIAQLSSALVLDFVGPSPFHADFCVEGYDVPSERRNRFEVQLREDSGYAQVTFRCSSQEFPASEEACEVLFGYLDDELDVFYMVYRSNSENLSRWALIEADAARIFDRSRESGKCSKLQAFRAKVSRGGEMAALHEELLRFEADHIRDQFDQERAFRNMYDREKPTFLRKFVDGSLSDRPVFPVRQMKELVTFAETRRSKTIELAFLLIAAVIGGLAGSAISQLVD